MKKITIKTIDGTRYELPSRDEIDVVERYGMYFLKLETDDAKRYINCQHIACIKEVEE